MLYIQTRNIIRWYRKPMHLGTAPSKMFRVPTRKKLPPEEYNELKRLHNHYKTHMKSLLSFIKSKYQIKEEKISEQEEFELFKKEYNERVEINDDWNQKCTLLRNERLKVQREVEIQQALEKMSIFEENERKRILRADELIRREKELSKSYVTEDKLDQAILEAIDSPPVDYNFAIDLKGNIYQGRITSP